MNDDNLTSVGQSYFYGRISNKPFSCAAVPDRMENKTQEKKVQDYTHKSYVHLKLLISSVGESYF